MHTIFLGRGQDDRNVEQLADGRMCDHVVVVERAVEIAGQVEETDLVVDDQQNLGWLVAIWYLKLP